MTNATTTSSRLLLYPVWGYPLWAEFDLTNEADEEDFDDDEEEDDDSDRLQREIENDWH